MRRSTCFLFPALLAGLLTSTADAGQVLMIGPSPSGLFTGGGLSQYGHTVTDGPSYNLFDGSTDLSAYDVIVLSAVNYGLPDMPLAGQQAIVDFVTNGGGLITGEWTTWLTSPERHALRTLYPLFPTDTDGSYVGGSPLEVSVRYEQVTADPILNAGLPTSMDFVVDYFGAEIIVPKAGATVFYSGDSISPYYVLGQPVDGVFPSAGLVGWNYGQGRVLTFSTTMQQPVGPDYTDNYSRLVANAIDWAGAGSPQQVPEPGSLTLFVLGGIGVIGKRMRRRLS